MVPPSLEISVPESREAGHNTCLFGIPQHIQVPVPQPIGAWYLLLVGVAVEDIVVPLHGGAGPDEHLLKTQALDKLEVALEEAVVGKSAEGSVGGFAGSIDIVGTKVLDGIQIAEVDAVPIGRRAVWAVLLDVHDKEAHVDTVKVLSCGIRGLEIIRSLIRGGEEGFNHLKHD